VLVVLLVLSYRGELGNAVHNRIVYDDLVLQLRGGIEDPVVRRASDFRRSKNTFGNEVLQMDPRFWGNSAFARYWQVGSVSVLPAAVYDDFYVDPGTATSNADYYIVMLDTIGGRVERVELSYRDAGQRVVRPAFLMLLCDPSGRSAVARWLARVGVPVLSKTKPLTVVLERIEGDDSFSELTWGDTRYLVVRRPAGYETDMLVGIETSTSAGR
jgi:hypothetical protein